MASLLQELNDGLSVANAVVQDYLNPNNAADKAAAQAAISQFFTDFGVASATSLVIGSLAADAIETVAGGTNASTDVLADISVAAASKGVTLNAVELMFLQMFVSTAVSAAAKLPKV